ncbi:MAG: bifunctional biotin--[acetyl-CoA-carboxylase] ligase/biotin operon repressor BirA [Bdellovibrio bacteriovorus]
MDRHSDRTMELVRLLADGGYHSGEAIAARLGITRAGVWKLMSKVRERLGLAVESARGRGYRLVAPLELLDAGRILEALRAQDAPPLARLEIHDQVDSTNARLMAEAQAGAPCGSACLAERQTAGRGRRGRTWVSPFGSNLYLSLLWRYPLAPAALSGVSLAAGVAAAQVLRDAGAVDLTLKWPNDLLWRRRKLGGLLLEVAGEAQGPSLLVAGLGVNLRMPGDQGRDIDQPWVDLAGILGDRLPGRNTLAARLIAALCETLERYGQIGMEPFLADWGRFDGLRGEPVRLHLGERVIEGTYGGIAPDGALLLVTAQGVQGYHAGEVSLRSVEDPAP